MNANVARYGIILNTENYAECVAFYRGLFGLCQLFERDEEGFKLTCLEFGHGYLMVEQGGAKQRTASIRKKKVALNCDSTLTTWRRR